MRWSLLLLSSVFSHGSQASEVSLSGSRSKKTILTQTPPDPKALACAVVQQADLYNTNVFIPAVRGVNNSLSEGFEVAQEFIADSTDDVFDFFKSGLDTVEDFIVDGSFVAEQLLNTGTNFVLSTIEVSVAAPISLANTALGCGLLAQKKMKLALLYPAMSVVMKQLGIKASDVPSDFVKQLSKMVGNQSKNHMADHKKK